MRNSIHTMNSTMPAAIVGMLLQMSVVVTLARCHKEQFVLRQVSCCGRSVMGGGRMGQGGEGVSGRVSGWGTDRWNVEWGGRIWIPAALARPLSLSLPHFLSIPLYGSAPAKCLAQIKETHLGSGVLAQGKEMKVFHSRKILGLPHHPLLVWQGRFT